MLRFFYKLEDENPTDLKYPLETEFDKLPIGIYDLPIVSFDTSFKIDNVQAGYNCSIIGYPNIKTNIITRY